MTELTSLMSQKQKLLSLAARAQRPDLILAMLLTRELAELLAPLQMLVILPALYYGPGPTRNLNSLVSNLTQEQFQTVLLYALVDILTELVIIVCTWRFLRTHATQPLALLRGIIVGHSLAAYTILLCTVWLYSLSLQYVPNGCDFSFEFSWLRDDNATAPS